MASLVGHHERGGEAARGSVQLRTGVAHPSDRSIAWRDKGARALSTQRGSRPPSCPGITRANGHSQRPSRLAQLETSSLPPGSGPQPCPSAATLQPAQFPVSRSYLPRLSATLVASGPLLSFRPPPTFLPHLAEWPFGPRGCSLLPGLLALGPGAWHHTLSRSSGLLLGPLETSWTLSHSAQMAAGRGGPKLIRAVLCCSRSCAGRLTTETGRQASHR